MTAPTFSAEDVKEMADSYVWADQTTRDMLFAYAALLVQQAAPCPICGAPDGKHV